MEIDDFDRAKQGQYAAGQTTRLGNLVDLTIDSFK
jgi:hypothetical protein